MLFGYQHPAYLRSLAEVGEAQFLSRSRGWILRRTIPGSEASDGMGAYPLFSCEEWERLEEDLKELEGRLVSITAVADPFGRFQSEQIRKAFPHLTQPYKEHFIMDLAGSREKSVSEHHRRNARHALDRVTIERCDPSAIEREWIALYGMLIDRHRIEGIAAFSPKSLAMQLRVPGLLALRAIDSLGATVGMTLWYACDERAYYHLAACSPRGYELKAAFALFWRAWEELAAQGVRWVNLGAGAGITNDSQDGLSRFKRGWATTTRTAWLCGRILNPAAYRSLTNAPASQYFPAYRDPLAVATYSK